MFELSIELHWHRSAPNLYSAKYSIAHTVKSVQENDILEREFNDDGVLRLVLNDSGRRNALSEAMLSPYSDAALR